MLCTSLCHTGLCHLILVCATVYQLVPGWSGLHCTGLYSALVFEHFSRKDEKDCVGGCTFAVICQTGSQRRYHARVNWSVLVCTGLYCVYRSTYCSLCVCQELLDQSSEPLSFIVFVPEWRDPVTPALTRMEGSRFLRHQLSVPAYEHEYRSGSQHICKRY